MWRITHQVTTMDGERIATVRLLEGTWFNWRSIEAVAPEADLVQNLGSVARAKDFQEMRPLFRSKGAELPPAQTP
jgi:hypothetical protein